MLCMYHPTCTHTPTHHLPASFPLALTPYPYQKKKTAVYYHFKIENKNKNVDKGLKELNVPSEPVHACAVYFKYWIYNVVFTDQNNC